MSPAVVQELTILIQFLYSFQIEWWSPYKIQGLELFLSSVMMTSHTVRKHTVPVGDQKHPKIEEQQLLVLGFSRPRKISKNLWNSVLSSNPVQELYIPYSARASGCFAIFGENASIITSIQGCFRQNKRFLAIAKAFFGAEDNNNECILYVRTPSPVRCPKQVKSGSGVLTFPRPAGQQQPQHSCLAQSVPSSIVIQAGQVMKNSILSDIIIGKKNENWNPGDFTSVNSSGGQATARSEGFPHLHCYRLCILVKDFKLFPGKLVNSCKKLNT